MKLHHLIFVLAVSFFLLPTLASAQGFSYGLRVGLNFANFSGDLEQDDAGEDIEKFKNNTGFHVGASVRYNFNDRFGLKADLLYAQKGTQQFIEGQGAQLFYAEGTKDQFGVTGVQKRFLRITNSYIEIPISAYGKFGKFEIFGGPYIAFLVGSKAVGDYKFTVAASGEEIDTDLNYNYFKDDAGDGTTTNLNPDDFKVFSHFGNELFYPDVFNAYYDFPIKDGRAFNAVDFGINAGLSYFLNRGLYVSATLNYGLADVSNKNYDHSYARLNEEDPNQYAKRDDTDQNFVIQASVGFTF